MNSAKLHDARDGVRDALPVFAAVVPFAAVFGALAVDAGLSVANILIASATIFAGASQYAMIELLGQKVPPWSIVLTVFAINFRHVLYSASIGRHLKQFSRLQKALAFFLLVDPIYASGEARAQRGTLRPAYYFAYGAVFYSTWMISNMAGVLFGAIVGDLSVYGFDYILPIYFTGLVIGFRRRPNFLPILIVSVIVSLGVYFTVGSPWHISLGGIAGLMLAAVLSKPEDNIMTASEEGHEHVA